MHAKEYTYNEIQVNATYPCFIDTHMMVKLRNEYLDVMAEQIPLSRLCKKGDMVGSARFLALDPAAEYTTGHCYDVDGGLAVNVA